MTGDGLKLTTEGLPKNWDGKHWRPYKLTMLACFKRHELTDIVMGTLERATLTDSEEQEEYDRKQARAMRFIGTSIPSHILMMIYDVRTAPEMWKALVEIYEHTNNVNLRALDIRRLLRELGAMRLERAGDADAHVTEMFSKRDELQDLQFRVHTIQMVGFLLDSLPREIEEFQYLDFVVSCDSETLCCDPEAVGEKIRRFAELWAQREAAGSGYGSRGQGRHVKQCRCWVCGSTDHKKKNCPERHMP